MCGSLNQMIVPKIIPLYCSDHLLQVIRNSSE